MAFPDCKRSLSSAIIDQWGLENSSTKGPAFRDGTNRQVLLTSLKSHLSYSNFKYVEITKNTLNNVKIIYLDTVVSVPRWKWHSPMNSLVSTIGVFQGLKFMYMLTFSSISGMQRNDETVGGNNNIKTCE